MVRRYVTGIVLEARSDLSVTAHEVIVTDPVTRDTGLVMPDGTKIFSVEQRPPMGFDPKRWA